MRYCVRKKAPWKVAASQILRIFGAFVKTIKFFFPWFRLNIYPKGYLYQQELIPKYGLTLACTQKSVEQYRVIEKLKVYSYFLLKTSHLWVMVFFYF